MVPSIPPDLEQFINDEVASGRYDTADQVVLDGLRLLQARNRQLHALLRDVDEGLAQIDVGEVIELGDGATQRAFFEDIKARGRSRLHPKQSGK